MDSELLESTVLEYKNISDVEKLITNGEVVTDRLVSILSKNHDWTHQGAQAIVCNGQVKTDTFFQAAFKSSFRSNSIGLLYPSVECNR
jgi:hypothetical protein